MFTGFGINAGHSQLLRDHTRTHGYSCPPSLKLELNFNVHTGRKIKLHKRINRLWSRVNDIEKTLMRTDLELLTAFLVYMRRTVDSELLDMGRKRNRTTNISACALSCGNDFFSRRIENAMVEMP